MIISNLDHLPDRKISRTLGIVFGYGSGHSVHGEGDELFSLIFKRAEDMLISRAEDMPCDAVLKVDGKITRDEEGTPEIMLIGTAVELEDDVAETSESATTGNENEEKWSFPPASPSNEVVSMIRSRGRNDRTEERKRKDIYDLADEIGISFDKASLLMENGYSSMERIADTRSRELAEINGINPTQARILIKKAREILDQERGL